MGPWFFTGPLDRGAIHDFGIAFSRVEVHSEAAARGANSPGPWFFTGPLDRGAIHDFGTAFSRVEVHGKEMLCDDALALD